MVIFFSMESSDNTIENKPADWPEISPGEIAPGLPKRLTREKARIWALVLDARGVPCCLEQPDPSHWELRVPEESLDRAVREIRIYEEKNRGWPPLPPSPRPLAENTLSTLSILILLATFYNVVRLDIVLPGDIRPDWLQAGSAQAEKILAGEWWRTITSLTLHSDVAHLAANLSIGGVFVFLLCRALGSGPAWGLILCSGILGNLANALIQPVSHNSVGASTAVFGTVGILASMNMVHGRSRMQRRWGLPVAGALSLLALLGSEGKNTDLGAHLFGLAAGILLGFAASAIIARRGHPGAVLNAVMALAAAMAVILAWVAAIAAGA